MVWWGLRKGRWVIREQLRDNWPATEWILVVSSDSSVFMGGKMPDSRRASMVFPEPGLPIISKLCAPAAAISKALFTFS